MRLAPRSGPRLWCTVACVSMRGGRPTAVALTPQDGTHGAHHHRTRRPAATAGCGGGRGSACPCACACACSTGGPGVRHGGHGGAGRQLVGSPPFPVVGGRGGGRLWVVGVQRWGGSWYEHHPPTNTDCAPPCPFPTSSAQCSASQSHARSGHQLCVGPIRPGVTPRGVATYREPRNPAT